MLKIQTQKQTTKTQQYKIKKQQPKLQKVTTQNTDLKEHLIDSNNNNSPIR